MSVAGEELGAAASATVTEASVDDCKAFLTPEGWKCPRCCLAWDDGDRRPACSPMTYMRLIDAAIDEAVLIETSQAALVTAQMRQFRYQPRLQRAMELRKLCDLAVKTREEKNG